MNIIAFAYAVDKELAKLTAKSRSQFTPAQREQLDNVILAHHEHATPAECAKLAHELIRGDFDK